MVSLVESPRIGSLRPLARNVDMGIEELCARRDRRRNTEAESVGTGLDFAEQFRDDQPVRRKDRHRTRSIDLIAEDHILAKW